MGDHEHVASALNRLIEAGMTGELEELESLLHDEVVMVFPGFSGHAQGRAALLAGFKDFCDNATVRAHTESDHHIDIVGGVAVGTYRFDMTYERDGQAYHSTGRDIWVFQKDAGRWSAAWRTMLDLAEEPAQ